MYRPLPESLTIKASEIEGLGLFAKEDIKSGTELGISHFEIDGEIIRTPLGGFYNHSKSPNVEKIENVISNKIYHILCAIKDIKAGDEITCEYTLYKL